MDLQQLLDNLQIFRESMILRQLTTIAIYGVLAKVTDLFMDRVLLRLAKRTSLTIDDHIILFLHRPVCWTLFLLGFLHALVIEPPPPPWNQVLPSLIQTLILLLWWIATLRTFNEIAVRNHSKIIAQGKIGQDLYLLLKNLFRVVLVVAGLLWLLSIWKMDLTPLFASAGIAGIAIALAAKDTLANFFGGISLFMDKTFKVGDYIILDSSERGEVVEIGIRSTRIKTRDDVLVTIPNSILANSKIINESAPIPRFRIRVPVGVAYGTNLEYVEKVLLEVAHKSSSVVEEPEPRVRIRLFNNSSIDLELLCWVKDPSKKGLVTHTLLGCIYQAFIEKGITIPFPQRDIHLITPPKTVNTTKDTVTEEN